jgi:transcriptional regulator with XRE-family HTH domain
MSTLGELVDAAIRSSGKTAQQIAETLDVDPNTISRLRNGKEDNPKLQLLLGIARETGTTPAVLLGASFEISPEDEHELQRFRAWIDRKLATIDALREPNAEIIREATLATAGDRRIADRSFKSAFGADAQLVLRALGESMIGEGILAGDSLYAIPDGGSSMSAVGRLIACRVGTDLFVKRLILEHNRRYLLSAHPRYRSIAIDTDGLSLEILGIVIGRSGRVE